LLVAIADDADDLLLSFENIDESNIEVVVCCGWLSNLGNDNAIEVDVQADGVLTVSNVF
jgi:hypothetical protein